MKTFVHQLMVLPTNAENPTRKEVRGMLEKVCISAMFATDYPRKIYEGQFEGHASIRDVKYSVQ